MMFNEPKVKAAYHDYFNSFLKSKADITKLLPKPLNDSSVLVVGCGYLYPDVLLYSTCAKEVVGIDVTHCFWRDGFLKDLVCNLKGKSGFKGILLSLNKAVKDSLGIRKQYYARLESYIGQKLSHEDLHLISHDGFELPFEDNYFDVVMSNAVLEHIMEPAVTIKEIARVSAPSGINYHLYHNYYSFSGNHQSSHLNKKYPWGHLRGLIETNPTHLNKVKISELKSHFQEYFRNVTYFCVSQDHSKMGINDGFSWEEEKLLEKYRKVLLKQYSEELLLSRAFLIVGEQKRKRF